MRYTLQWTYAGAQREALTPRWGGRLAWGLWALCVVLAAGGLVFAVVDATHIRGWDFFDGGAAPAGSLIALSYGTVGALIAYQRHNLVGWILLITGLLSGIHAMTFTYAEAAYLSGVSLPFGQAAAWVQGWLINVLVPGEYVLYLVFPTGALISRRWRFAVGLVALVMVALVTIALVAPQIDLTPLIQHPIDNPTGIKGLNVHGGLDWPPTNPLRGLVLLTCLGSVVVRYRGATSLERQQIKWLAFVAGLMIVSFASGAVLVQVGSPLGVRVLGLTVLIGLGLGVPLASVIAITRYHLYDIDVLISRTVVYAALAAFITAVYVGIVVGVGTLIGSGDRPNLALSIVATAIVAVAFQAVRERLQKVANRLVYGKRATPYEVLSQFSERVAESYAADDVLPRMARVLADGTGAERADVWLRAGDMLRRAASWPVDSASSQPARVVDDSIPDLPEADRAVEVRHQGELLGALTVNKRQGESLTPVEEKLLDDLASQAGLVLKNVGLTDELLRRLEDLRASRQRLVAAQDDERRRLERNLHDGAQQNLVALKVKLGLAEMLIDKDAARSRALLSELKADADEALETLRSLARGIYPPLLADRGLQAALESQVRKATLPVEVKAVGLGRYPQEIEAAVYFCCLEALQNVQKYAEAASAVLRLNGSGGLLTFELIDNGNGFDAATVKRGAGLTNMTDRINALGGSLEMSSTLGSGTRVYGSLPALGAAVPA